MWTFEAKNGAKIIFDDSTHKYLLCEGTIQDIISAAEEDLKDEDPAIFLMAAEVILKLFLYKEMTEEEVAVFIMAIISQIKEEL